MNKDECSINKIIRERYFSKSKKPCFLIKGVIIIIALVSYILFPQALPFILLVCFILWMSHLLSIFSYYKGQEWKIRWFLDKDKPIPEDELKSYIQSKEVLWQQEKSQ